MDKKSSVYDFEYIRKRVEELKQETNDGSVNGVDITPQAETENTNTLPGYYTY